MTVVPRSASSWIGDWAMPQPHRASRERIILNVFMKLWIIAGMPAHLSWTDSGGGRSLLAGCADALPDRNSQNQGGSHVPSPIHDVPGHRSGGFLLLLR